MTERTRAKRIYWLDYQKRHIADTARYLLYEKSRRVGFDWTEAYKQSMLRGGGQRDRDLWYTSADESAAAEFIEYCKQFNERASHVADYFTEDIEDAGHPKGSIKTFCVRFANGSRINALTSNPRRMRSKGGDVTISEFAFHDDPQKLYAAAQPVMMWGDRMTIGSTHNGVGSKFNRFCGDARAFAEGRTEIGGRLLTPWSHHVVDIHAAVAQGLVRLINLERGTSFGDDEFLKQLRAGCDTEDDWLQEYCCQPSTETTAWLPYDLIYTCEDASCPQPGEPLAALTGGPVYYGVDVGRKKDLTVAWFFEQVGDVLVTRRILVLEKTPIPQQIQIIAGAARQAGAARGCIDATGIGLGVGEGLQALLGQYAVELVTFTNPVKEALAVPVRSRFEDRSIRIPDNDQIREGLHKVRKTVTATGAIRFDAARDDSGHADEFWAAALGIHAAGTSSGAGAMVI